ncbi:MAG: SDR family NAD(P)-dependent oxidoreductase [Pirellulales bacterium]
MIRSSLDEPNLVLLTGATGLVGRYLLKELLERGIATAIIVRSQRRGNAAERAHALLGSWAVPKDAPQPLVFSGDLTKPQAGLDEQSIVQLSRYRLQVIHCAASVRFQQDAVTGEPFTSNVTGTEHLIDLCRRLQVTDFHHVSTAYVHRFSKEAIRSSVAREVAVAQAAADANDYERSKVLAERAVSSASHLGSVSIYRPSIIVGDSQTGFTSTFHGFYAPLKAGAQLAVTSSGLSVSASELIRLALGVEADDTKNLVPVDWVARSIIELVCNRRSHGRIFHLTHPRPVLLRDMQRAIVDELAELPGASFREKQQASTAVDAAAFRELMQSYASYFQTDPGFDRSHTEQFLEQSNPPLITYDMMRRLARYAVEQNFGWPAASVSNTSRSVSPSTAVETLREPVQFVAAVEDQTIENSLHRPLAIVGMACRLPGADDLEQYWDLLRSGGYAVTRMPEERLNRKRYYDPRKNVRGKTYADVGGLISSREIDWDRLGVTADERAEWDEAHWILCETAVRACEHAGYDPHQWSAGSTGIYIGHSGGSNAAGELAYRLLSDEYLALLDNNTHWRSLPEDSREKARQELHAAMCAGRPLPKTDGRPRTAAEHAAALIAKVLGCNGPQMVIDAACASSLTALALAAAALENNQIETAIVGGASFNKGDSLVLFSQAQSCSARGSRPFDAEADGLISSEGYVVFIIKTLERAIADGDKIEAVIRGIGVSSDGRGRSLWAPRKEGQFAAVERAYSPTVPAATVQMIEAHATSTQVGDATEMEALASYFKQHVPAERQVHVGSVKSNIGHTLETAGLAGLLKTVLSIQHGCVPPSVNVSQLNSSVPWDDIPLVVARQALPWPQSTDCSPRRAAVNAFGIGGLNVHVVVDQFEPALHRPLKTHRHRSEPIAVIGRGLVAPGALDVAQFESLLSGSNAQPPAPDLIDLGPSYAAARVRRADGFAYDWRKHKIPPKQIAQANPLQFMLLEAAEQALREAGVLEHNCYREHTAVVVGGCFGGDFGNALYGGLRLPEFRDHLGAVCSRLRCSTSVADALFAEYEAAFLKAYPALLDETGSFTSSTLASRLTKTFDLMGGAAAIDAGPASGLAALDAAVNLLRSGSVKQVLCAAAHRTLDRASLIKLQLQNHDPGFIPGEGAALLVLKRLSDAQADGDRVLCTIDTVTAEYVHGDSSGSRNVLSKASQVCGDLGGAQALVDVIAATIESPQSDRSTVQITRVTDTGLRLSATIRPAHVTVVSNVSEMNTRSSSTIHAEPIALKRKVVTEALADENDVTILRSAVSFDELADQLRTASRQTWSQTVADSKSSVAATIPSRELCKAAALLTSTDHAQKLMTLAGQVGKPSSRVPLAEQGLFWTGPRRAKSKTIWMFPGQGSQYLGMLADWVECDAPARSALAEADAALKALGEPSFAELAWGEQSALGEDVWHTQAAMLVADMILMRSLQARGFAPDVVAGHSFGEFAAMIAAGCWDFATALVATRHRCRSIVDNVPSGCSMLSIQADAESVRKRIGQSRLPVYLSHINAPQQTVVGGKTAAVAQFAQMLDEDSIACRTLAVPTAFHTPALQPAQRSFEQALAELEISPPRIPLLSSVTNRYEADPDAIREGLVKQLVSPLDFVSLVQRALRDGVTDAVEVGPQNVLTRLVQQTAPDAITCIAVDHARRGTRRQMAAAETYLQMIQDTPRVDSQFNDSTAFQVGSVVHFDATEKRRASKRMQANGLQTRHESRPSVAAPPIHFDASRVRKEANLAAARPESNLPHVQPPVRIEAIAPQPSPMVVDVAANRRPAIESFLVQFVVEQTGYPPEIIDLDWDMEADLGIDSIKKAQLFGELREYFDLEAATTAAPLRLDRFRSLRDIADLLITLPGKADWLTVHESSASISVAIEAEPQVATLSGQPSTKVSAGSAPSSSQLEQFLINFVVEQTGYPPEIVDLDADLEADLGIDSIKKAQLFGELREMFEFPAHLTGGNRAVLSDFRTLRSVSELLSDSIAKSPLITSTPTANPLDAELLSDATVPTAVAVEEIDPPVGAIGNDNDEIAHRFILRMVPHALPECPQRHPNWSGAALIIGDNPAAAQLEARLRATGVSVTRWSGSDNPHDLAERFEVLHARTPIRHLFLMTACDADAATTFDAAAWQSRRNRGLMSLFWLCQRWHTRMVESGWMDDVSLTAVTSLGGDFGVSGRVHSIEGGGLAGLLKSILIESWVQGFRTVPIKIVDTSTEQSPAEIVDAIWREAATPNFDMEVAYRQGSRHVLRAVKRPIAKSRTSHVRRGGNWICTGGARGITAYVAESLGLRYDLTLHLVGTQPLPQLSANESSLDDEGLRALKVRVMSEARAAGKNPIDAWQDMEKAMEIHATLRRMRDQGLDVHYHSCNVADRAQVAATMDRIRALSGPIHGVLHGAGVGKDARFDRKQEAKVNQCFAAKVDGALALMDALRDDPLEHFIGFGSISGRFGANGHTDYSAANDMLCKTLDWFRSGRPEVKTTAFHWHAWGDVGMATKPETKLALEMIQMQFMPAAEGLLHLVRELEGGQPESEVLITDDRYYRLFYAPDSESQRVLTPLLAGSRDNGNGSHLSTAMLNPRFDPFLNEHRYEGKPLLPIVIGAELLLEGAKRHLSTRGGLAVRNLEAVQALRFFSDAPREVRILTRRSASGAIIAELRSDFHARDGRLVQADRVHFTAEIEMTQPATNGSVRFPLARHTVWQRPRFPDESAEFTIGPALRRLRGFVLTEQGIVGKIAAPALIELAGGARDVGGWVSPSAALDACLFTVGILAWHKIAPGTALPARIAELRLGRMPFAGEICEVHARLISSDHNRAAFDFTLYGVDGAVIVDVRGYEAAWVAAAAASQRTASAQVVGNN